MRLPFSFAGVSLTTSAGPHLRLRIEVEEERARIELFDALGAPLGLIEAATSRPFDPSALRAGTADPLYALGWQALPSADEGQDSKTG